MNKSSMLVLTGPAASGKDSVRNILINNFNYKSVISTTDRLPRPGEIEGVNYYFKTVTDFIKDSKNGKFAEEVEFANRKYALTYDEINKMQQFKTCAILEPNGIQQLLDNSISLYIVMLIPDSIQLMRERMISRKDSLEEIDKRIKLYPKEISGMIPLANMTLVSYKETKLEDLAEIINKKHQENNN